MSRKNVKTWLFACKIEKKRIRIFNKFHLQKRFGYWAFKFNYRFDHWLKVVILKWPNPQNWPFFRRINLMGNAFWENLITSWNIQLIFFNISRLLFRSEFFNNVSSWSIQWFNQWSTESRKIRPPKFYSKCSAFGFVFKMSCS